MAFAFPHQKKSDESQIGWPPTKGLTTGSRTTRAFQWHGLFHGIYLVHVHRTELVSWFQGRLQKLNISHNRLRVSSLPNLDKKHSSLTIDEKENTMLLLKKHKQSTNNRWTMLLMFGFDTTLLCPVRWTNITRLLELEPYWIDFSRALIWLAAVTYVE